MLIIGGGIAGLSVIRNLSKKHSQITLIDIKNYFEVLFCYQLNQIKYTPSILEALVNPPKFDQIAIPYDKIIQKYRNVKFIHAQLVHPLFINQRLKITFQNNVAYILTQTNQKLQLQFDACVIATGSWYTPPIKPSIQDFTFLEQRKLQIINENQQLQNADNILIVGAGIVGVELACELKYKFKTKSITLISRSGILTTMPARAQRLATNRLEKLGITFYPKTNKDDLNIVFDMIYYCIGNKFGKFNEGKQLVVNEHLQFEQNVFSAGDIALSTLGEEKSALSAELYGELVAHNMQNRQKMKKIKWCPRTYIISVGGRQAIWVFEGIAIGGMMGYCMKRMIEKTKLIQIRGSCIMDFVWDVIHIILFAMTCIYMVLSMCFGQLFIDRPLKQKQKEELKELKEQVEELKQK